MIEKKLKNILINFIMFVISVYVFLIFGNGKYILQKDSTTYMAMPKTVSVMPIYPLLIGILENIFGVYYLQALVIAQGFWAIFCTGIFVFYICRKFNINGIERLAIYLPTLLPFSIYLPDHVVIQQILTESITYSLIYIYIILLFQTIIKKNYSWWGLTAVCGIILNLCRSQFIIIHIITVVSVSTVFFYQKELNLCKKIVVWLVNLVMLIAIIMCVYKVANIIVGEIYPIVSTDNMIPSDAIYTSNIEPENEEVLLDSNNRDGKYEKEIHDIAPQVSYKGQFAEIIILRGFYLAKSIDKKYFTDEQLCEAFEAIYDRCTKENILMEDTGVTLGYWQEMFNEKITRSAYSALKEYYSEQGLCGGDLWNTIHNDFIKIGLTLIIVHFPTFILCCLRLLGAGIMASLFYQKLSIYVICMVITALLCMLGSYFAVRYRNKAELEMEYYYLLTIGYVILTFVIIISIVFFPLQRYLIYFQGMYYIALFLCIRKTEVYKKVREKFEKYGCKHCGASIQ